MTRDRKQRLASLLRNRQGTILVSTCPLRPTTTTTRHLPLNLPIQEQSHSRVPQWSPVRDPCGGPVQGLGPLRWRCRLRSVLRPWPQAASAGAWVRLRHGVGALPSGLTIALGRSGCGTRSVACGAGGSAGLGLPAR